MFATPGLQLRRQQRDARHQEADVDVAVGSSGRRALQLSRGLVGRLAVEPTSERLGRK